MFQDTLESPGQYLDFPEATVFLYEPSFLSGSGPPMSVLSMCTVYYDWDVCCVVR